jgi:hypothetical protein
MIYEKCPDSIDPKQIERKENNRNQGYDCRILHLVCRRPRDPPHFRAGVAQELPGALKKSGARARQPTLASDCSSFGAFAKRCCTWSRRSNWLHHGSVARRGRFRQSANVFVFVFFCRHFFSRYHELLYTISTILAGVPGFEPGLSVLETDVLTVDTIPLLTLPIADFRLLICGLKQIGNRKCHFVSL